MDETLASSFKRPSLSSPQVVFGNCPSPFLSMVFPYEGNEVGDFFRHDHSLDAVGWNSDAHSVLHGRLVAFEPSFNCGHTMDLKPLDHGTHLLCGL